MTSKSAAMGVRNVERPRPLGSASKIGILASGTNMTNSNPVANRIKAIETGMILSIVDMFLKKVSH
jgi:hypothetical protein